MAKYSDDPAVEAILRAWVERGAERYAANKRAIDADNADYARQLAHGNRPLAERDKGTAIPPKAVRTPVSGFAGHSEAKERSAKVLEYLLAHPYQSFTARDLAGVFGVSPSAARRSLTWLRREGRVTSSNRGWTAVLDDE